MWTCGLAATQKCGNLFGCNCAAYDDSLTSICSKSNRSPANFYEKFDQKRAGIRQQIGSAHQLETDFVMVWGIRKSVRCESPGRSIHITMAIPTEQPLYLLPQDKKRILIPKIITLLFLATLFYLGVLLNISLLSLSASDETTVKLASLLLLLLIVVLGIFLNFRGPYRFYSDKLIINKKEVFYHTINGIARKQNFLDKLFKTYSLNLGNGFVLKNIPQEIEVQNYIQQLATYAQRAPPQF